MNNVTDIVPWSNLGTRARRAAARLVTAPARLGRDTRGATMVEYAVLVGLLSAGAITLIVATGDTMSRPWTALAGSLPGASDGTVPGDTAAANGPAATGDESGAGPSDGTSVADGGGGDSAPSGGGQGGDTDVSGEFDVAATTSGAGGATSGRGGVASGAGGTGNTGGNSGPGQGGESAATSGSGQSSASVATSGGSSLSSGGSAASAGLAGGSGASGVGGDGGGGGSQGGAGTAMAAVDPTPYGAAETETGIMEASLVWRAKSLGTALLAQGASGELGAALLEAGGQGAGSTVAVLEEVARGKHPWLALLMLFTVIAAFYAIAKKTKSARFKKRLLAIADHRWA